MQKKKATRLYRELKSRTTTKSRQKRSDRVPGDQFDPGKVESEGYLAFDDSPEEEFVEVDPSEVEEVVTFAEDTMEEPKPRELPLYDEPVEVGEDEVEEAYYDEPFEKEDDEGEATAAADMKEEDEEDEEEREKEGCMYKQSKEEEGLKAKASFADRLKIAMDPAADLDAALGEEVAPPVDAPALDEAPVGEGPCPAGCVAVESEEPAEEGIVDVALDDADLVMPAEEEEREKGGAAEMPMPSAKDLEMPKGASVVEVLADVGSLGNVSAERVDLVLANEQSENPHYVVLVDGNPIAKVALNDQPEALTRDHQDMFLDEEYPKYVLEGITNFGLTETLQHINARYYAASALEGKVADQMRTAAAEDLRQEQRHRIAEMKDGLINTANLVIEASVKNYILDNPLRDELVREMREAGVDPHAAVDIVERAWRARGSDYFRNILAKAEEWLGAPPEVLQHHMKEISGMSYRHPGYDGLDSMDEFSEERVAEVRSTPRSVPIRTMASTRQAAPEATQMSDREYWKQQLNLHGRLLQKSLSSKPR